MAESAALPGHDLAHGAFGGLVHHGLWLHADWEAKQNEADKNPALKKEIDAISLKDGEHLGGTRSFLGSLRKDLSYGPPVEIGKMRYFRIRTFRVKQGMTRTFEEGVKAALAAYEKSHFPASFAFYEVEAGTWTPTFVVLRPMKSLADMDAMDTANKAFMDALGEEGRKAMQKTFTGNGQRRGEPALRLQPQAQLSRALRGRQRPGLLGAQAHEGTREVVREPGEFGPKSH